MLASSALGTWYGERGDTYQMLAHSEDALDLAQRIGAARWEAAVACARASHLVSVGQPSVAIEPAFRALDIYEQLHDTLGLAAVHGQLAFCHQYMGDLEVALAHFLKQAAFAESANNDAHLTGGLINAAANQIQMGRWPDATTALDRLDGMLAEGRISSQARFVRSIRYMWYFVQGRCQEAMRGYRSLIPEFEDYPNKTWPAYVRGRTALALNCLGDHRAAIAIALEGFGMAKAANLPKEMVDNCEPLLTAYEALGDHKNALLYTRIHASLTDSIAGAERIKSLTSARLNHQFDRVQLADSLANEQRRERDSLLAEQRVDRERNRRNVAVMIGLLVLFFAMVVVRQRNRIGKEKARSEQLLLNILPEEVAEELKANGSAEAVHFDQVTVLFTDFKGFTAMSEVLTPQQLVRDLNECFSAFDHIMEKHGIEKIKTIGDAYMAAGGLPTPNSTHALDVVKAALEIRDFIAEGKALKIAKGLPYFEIRIGIHTGPVVAGIVGVKKFQYDIWGDTVNTASRMESSGEVGQVNISEATYALVKDTLGLRFTPRGKVQAKGKGEMEMYFVMDHVNA